MNGNLHNNMPIHSQGSTPHPQSQLRSYLIQQQTLQQTVQPISPVTPVTPAPPIPVSMPFDTITPSSPSTYLPVDALDTASLKALPARKRSFTKLLAVAIALGLAVAIYFIWQPAPAMLASNNSSVQNTGSVSTNAPSNTGSTSDTGNIQVYVLGAVKTPGLYTLPTGARVYDLIKAAGGTLPKANLVALNMAAKLNDGEEVYVTQVGETPPTYTGGVPGLSGGNNTPTTSNGGIGGGSAGGATGSTTGTATGQLVNINTADVTELRQSLHVSSKTAQDIVDYRTQNGNYTSVQQLLQVVSRSIYDKIRNECTV